jgi:hypothetical protein
LREARHLHRVSAAAPRTGPGAPAGGPPPAPAAVVLAFPDSDQDSGSGCRVPAPTVGQACPSLDRAITRSLLPCQWVDILKLQEPARQGGGARPVPRRLPSLSTPSEVGGTRVGSAATSGSMEVSRLSQGRLASPWAPWQSHLDSEVSYPRQNNN